MAGVVKVVMGAEILVFFSSDKAEMLQQGLVCFRD